MNFTAQTAYHIYNRGNNKQTIFFKEDDYILFLQKIRLELLPFVDILSYCLMPNHFHFLVFVKKTQLMDTTNQKSKTLNQAIAVVLRSYARVMQNKRDFTGSLFQQKTKAKEIEDSRNQTINSLSIYAHYIHQNPVRAKLTTTMSDWPFSSFKDYAGIRNGTLCNRELFYSMAAIEKQDFLEESEQMLSDGLAQNLF